MPLASAASGVAATAWFGFRAGVSPWIWNAQLELNFRAGGLLAVVETAQFEVWNEKCTPKIGVEYAVNPRASERRKVKR
jgi:hypothetical protein